MNTYLPAEGGTSSRGFFGQPRALAYLAFTEAWERFSYYGMTALLVLYMTESLLQPGHIEHIRGFAAFRGTLESVFGPLGNVALASQIYGLYTGFVYFTPVLGGWIADRWIGARNAVVLGAVLMSAGQIGMAFDATFLVALLLLIVGCGFLKGNISTQVGTLYAPEDAVGRTRGFSIFSMGINVGATIGPLLCGLVAQLYGWHAGFALAGVLMLAGLGTYLAGYRSLADSVRRAAAPERTEGVAEPAPWRMVAALFAVMFITIFQSVAYYQNSNISLVWIHEHVKLNALGFHVPEAWFNSIDPLVSILAVPPLFALWRWQGAHGGEPGELGKIGTGAWIACAANLLLVAGCLSGRQVPALVPVLYDVLLGVAFLYYWPTLLALVSRRAPPRVRATLMGAVFLTLFLSNLIIGALGTLYERLGPLAFWMLHAVIAAVGGVLALLLGASLHGLLDAAAPRTKPAEASVTAEA
ncbi:MAG TPA: peptide MFS transporter [Steroidobacteraceae bacterium]|nr:peptide MFS transporter [Steroidobacteraceae bacterium]